AGTEVEQFTSSGWSRGETMKRILSTMLSAAALVGCQAPTGPQHMSYKPAGMDSDPHGQPAASAASSTDKTYSQAAKPTGDVMQVGYTTGHGLMRNTNSGRQRVAAAIPSHGGHPPGPAGMMPGPMGPGPVLGGYAGLPLGPRFTSGRTQIRFAG